MRAVIFMKQETKQQLAQSIRDFHLPRYHEIPNVGLYLDQATKYVGEHLAPLGEYTLTPSMIRNYVSKGLIGNPVKKQYGREQIAYLFFIAVAKNVLSMENLSLFISIQKESYSVKKAYDYFCAELENVMEYAFGIKSELANVGNDETEEKHMLRNTIITAAYKLHLDCCFDVIRADYEADE